MDEPERMKIFLTKAHIQAMACSLENYYKKFPTKKTESLLRRIKENNYPLQEGVAGRYIFILLVKLIMPAMGWYMDKFPNEAKEHNISTLLTVLNTSGIR